MSHSVSGHLALQVADYDQLIRRLVPAYETMRRVQLEVLDLLGGARPPGALGPTAFRPEQPLCPARPEVALHLIDLGGGTGALAEAIAQRFPAAHVEIWDTDPTMLEIAQTRCARMSNRVSLIPRSFVGPFPTCDAIAAAIALHHVKDLTIKAQIYRNIYAALRPGGIFVNADTAVASSGPAQDFAYAKWIADMATHGIGAPEARAHLASWAREDYYPPLIQELDMLRAAGFAEPEVFWREGAAVVFGGIK